MEYEIIRSSRRTIAIQITPDGRVMVRSPRHMSRNSVDEFVRSKQVWIEKHLAIRQTRPAPPPLTREQLQTLAEEALAFIPDRAAYYAPLVGVSYGQITIRAQRSRWGSCSSKGNLNFNCLLMLVPAHVLDYVVVHELCHLRELNHSPRFWAEVERILPDYKVSRTWLKEHGDSLIGMLPSK